MLPAEAATLPLGGLTALQALDALALEPGSTLLVTGAAGAVGGFTVELAAQRGIHVVASAGTGDEDFVRTVGGTVVRPPLGRPGRPGPRARPAGRGRGGRRRRDRGARAGGRCGTGGLSSRSSPGPRPSPCGGISVTEHWVAADGAGLARLSDLAGSGRLTLRVADTMPLAEAARAHRRLAEGGMRGAAGPRAVISGRARTTPGAPGPRGAGSTGRKP
ncbi:hypothetical protein GCM10020000_54170 [Streptomyces olivoverticillatus]